MPAPSQTIGPFFHEGLKWVQSHVLSTEGASISSTLFGTVFDGEGAPVTDALLEFYSPVHAGATNSHHRPHGFARCATDSHGIYRVQLAMPTAPALNFLNVFIFARGLLAPAFTRVYLVDAATARAADATFAQLSENPRAVTLLAQRESGAFRWDVRLQGEGETIFFERS